MQTLFAVTSAAIAGEVVSNGLFADGAGRSVLLTDMRVANAFARDQLGADRYAVFEVAPTGLHVRPRRRRGRAPICRYQRLVRQTWIEPPYLRLVGTFDTISDRPTDWDREVASQLGISRTTLDALFEAREWARREIGLGVLTEQQVTHELSRRLGAAFDLSPSPSQRRTPPPGGPPAG